jgi:TonB-linked SusC/RagA family outer membrane protein
MSINQVNPNDIKTVTVLKDAAAAAIYGARAAHGVILITTKTGKGKMKFTYKGNYQVRSLTRMPETINSVAYVELAKKAGIVNPWYKSDYVKYMKLHMENPDKYPNLMMGSNGRYIHVSNTNWVKETLKEASSSQSHNMSVSGGNDRNSYYASVGYFSQDGMFKKGNDKFERLNTNLKVNTKVNERLSFDFNVQYNRTNIDRPYSYRRNVFADIYQTATTRINIHNQKKIWMWNPNLGENGDFEIQDWKPSGRYAIDNNPNAYLDKGGRDIYVLQNLWLTIGNKIKIIDGFNIVSKFSYNSYNGRNDWHHKKIDFEMSNPNHVINYTSSPDSYHKSTSNNNYYVFDTYAEFSKDLFNIHSFKFMAGYNQEFKEYSSHRSSGKDLLVADFPALDLTMGDKTIDGGKSEWAVRGSFFRFNYRLLDRYLLEVNGRYDLTSKFPEKRRAGFFPSSSFGWRISEEPFLKPMKKYISNLKLRASYGVLGNQNVSNYAYVSTMGTRNEITYLINNDKPNGVTPGGLAAPDDITWEETATKNLGINLGILKNRLNINFDYFVKDISNLLKSKEFPNLLGTSPPKVNSAEIQTKGFELELSWQDKIGSDFSYYIKTNLSDFTGEITKYENKSGSLSDYYEGKEIGEIWGYGVDGLFQSDEEAKEAFQGGSHDQSRFNGSAWRAGDVKYSDLNGDGKINNGKSTLEDHGDLKVIGNSTPRYRFGINSGFQYKEFDFNIFFQGVGKRDFWPTGLNFWPFDSKYQGIVKETIKDVWSEDNRGGYMHRLSINNGMNRVRNSRYLQDGKYIRLKSLTIGYNLPKLYCEKFGLNSFRLYLTGENLWEATALDVDSMDPEGSSSGKMYPFQRVLSFGINIGI